MFVGDVVEFRIVVLYGKIGRMEEYDVLGGWLVEDILYVVNMMLYAE